MRGGSCKLLATAGPAARARLHHREGSLLGGGASERMTWISFRPSTPLPLGTDPSGESAPKTGRECAVINGPGVAIFQAGSPSILPPMALAIKTHNATPYSRPPSVAEAQAGPCDVRVRPQV